MRYLLKRFRAGDLRDDLVEEFCSHWLSLLGIRWDQTWTLHSVVTLLSLAYSLAIWTYSYLQAEQGDANESLNRVSIALLALGIYSVLLLRQGEIRRVARQTDSCFLFTHHPDINTRYRRTEECLLNSGLKRFADVYTLLVFLAWANSLLDNYLSCLMAAAPPRGMVLPVQSFPAVILHHLLDTLFVINGCIVDMIVSQFFMMFSLRIVANFRVLRATLEDMDPLGLTHPQLVLQLNSCVKQHQEIIRTFAMVKALFDRIFYFLYLSMMGCLAMCRTLLVGGKIDLGLLLPIYTLELGYIGLFCGFADKISQEGEALRLSSYSTPWYDFPKSLCCDIRIIIIRASKPLELHFYFGGTPISCTTFKMIVNGSLTYFTFSFMMDRQGIGM